MWLNRHPLPWGDENFQRLVSRLCSAYDVSHKARAVAEALPAAEAGLLIPLVNWERPMRDVWRDLLDEAARQQVAQRLLNLVLDDPTVRSYHDDFRSLLNELSHRLDAAPATGSLRWQQRPTGILDQVARDELDDVLARLRDRSHLPGAHRMAECVWAAMRATGPIPVEATAGVAALVDLLDTRTSGDGTSLPPVLAFLEHLATGLDPTCDLERRRLQGLVDGVVERLSIAPAARDGVRAAAAEEPGPGRVLIHIALHEAGPGRIRPTVLIYRPDTPASFRYDDDHDHDVAQAQGAAERMIGRVGRLVAGVPLAQLRVEFAAPWQMLGAPFDEWHFPDGRSIGVHAEVTVRLLDDIRDPYGLSDWQRRSREIRGDGDAEPDELVRMLPAETRPGRGLSPSDRVVCLILPGPYRPPANWPDPHLLLDAIKDGLPIAIWMRQGDNPDLLLELARKAVRAGLDQIPSEVRQMRETDHHQGPGRAQRPVSLYYDDYHLRPLRNPRSSGGAE